MKNPKPLLILIIALFAVFIILLLGRQILVGRAAYFIPPELIISPDIFIEYSAGAEEAVLIPLEAGREFTINVGANLGDKNSTAFEFVLSYPRDILDIQLDQIDSSLRSYWGEDFFRKILVQAPNLNTLKLEHATWNFSQAITGSVHLAELTFTVRPGKELNGSNIDLLRFTDFKVFDLDSLGGQENIIATFTHPSGEVRCPDCPNPTWDACQSVCEANAEPCPEAEPCEIPPLAPLPSLCDDGKIGFIDANNNQIKDPTEIIEACDNPLEVGCHNCLYLELGYKGVNCQPASLACHIIAMTPQELLKEKLAALAEGKCYPEGHPQPLYCEAGVSIINYEEFDSREKTKLLAQVSTAFDKFFQQTSP